MTRIATYLTAAAGLRPLRPWLAVAVMLVRLGATAAESEPARTTVDPYRLNAQTMRRLSENQAKQNAAARTWPVFHQFKFSDALPQSGINFEHHIVDDAGKTWKPAHYDHGSAVAVADVDGDGLTDVFFVNQLGGNRLYRNLGQGRFADITASAGVALTSRVCVAASFADVDNDGRPDLFVTTVRMGNAFFKNMGGGRFQDTTKEAGLDYVGHSSGAVFFDFNRDGWVDLFLANVGVYTSDRQGRGGFYLAYDDAFRSHLIPARSESSILYQNLGGGRFQDVSAEMHLQDRSWSGDASACDLNQDGYPDLYVLNMQGDDHFYENDRGKGFIDRTARYFARTPWGTMGIKFFDFNLDGRMDLFLTDMHSDMTTSQTTLGKRDYSDRFSKEKSERWCSSEWTDLVLQGASNNIFGNAFYRNDGQGQFTEISDQLGAETYWPWGISVADFNADGYEDVFVTAGMGYPFRYGINSLLLNDHGQRWLDSEFVLGIEPRTPPRIEHEFYTLDCSGADKDNPLCYHKKGVIGVLGSASSRSSVAFDLDDDGDLDIVTNEQNDRPQVFRSDLSQRRQLRFLKIKLVGTASNRDGLGATVRVVAGGQQYVRYHDGKSGYLAQSSAPLYYGLDATSAIDRIEIQWPSGRKQVLDHPAINSLVTITEPGSP